MTLVQQVADDALCRRSGVVTEGGLNGLDAQALGIFEAHGLNATACVMLLDQLETRCRRAFGGARRMSERARAAAQNGGCLRLALLKTAGVFVWHSFGILAFSWVSWLAGFSTKQCVPAFAARITIMECQWLGGNRDGIQVLVLQCFASVSYKYARSRATDAPSPRFNDANPVSYNIFRAADMSIPRFSDVSPSVSRGLAPVSA
ncbi:MAG: hypothetical protein ACQESR_06420 [Planctomycetota bacterium]